MFCGHFSNSTDENASSLPPLRLLPALILYGDDPAYRRALRALAPVIETGQLRATAVHFNALATCAGRIHAALGLAKSDIFVLSTSSEGGLPAAIEVWLQGAFGGLHRTSGTILALLGTDERPDAPTSDRYKLLQRAALGTGWDFFALPRIPFAMLNYAEVVIHEQQISTAAVPLSK